jgi:hypothetical protein
MIHMVSKNRSVPHYEKKKRLKTWSDIEETKFFFKSDSIKITRDFFFLITCEMYMNF